MHFPLATATVGNPAARANRGAGDPLEDLFDGVDDLIKRVADTDNLEIRKIRAKVHASMVVARNAFEERAARARLAEAPLGADFDGYMGDDPEQALGVALLVGVGLGVIMSSQH